VESPRTASINFVGRGAPNKGVNPTNVFDFDTPLIFENRYGFGRGELLSPPTFVGNEARLEFTDLEPTREDNLIIPFLWPSEWQRILALGQKSSKIRTILPTALSAG
jgi:hypothetical protein